MAVDKSNKRRFGMKNSSLAVVAVAFLVIVVGLVVFIPDAASHFGTDRERIDIFFDDTRVDAVVSRTAAQRTQGLSDTPFLNEHEGMLFIFHAPGKYSFWMKEMLIPIDMIWLDENKRVTYVESRVTPETFPESFGPNRDDTLYVIETNAGYAEQWGIEVGDIATFFE